MSHSQTLVSLALASVADLLLYIHSLRTILSLEKHSHLAILYRLKTISRGDSSGNKVRPLRCLTEIC